MRGLLTAATALTVFAISSTTFSAIAQDAAGAAPASIWEGVGAQEQIDRGGEAYFTNCSGCHGTELRAMDPNAPDLRGPNFDYNWVGKTVGERFTRIRDTMPLGAPRSLSDETYVDILAYVLSVNGAPLGEAELPADSEYLNQIAIDARP